MTWYNFELFKTQHCFAHESENAVFDYASLEHESGEVKINVVGFKSGRVFRTRYGDTITEYKKQRSYLNMHVIVKKTDIFPQLLCYRESYAGMGTQFRVSDSIYAAKILDAIIEKYGGPRDFKDFLIQAFSDWEHIDDHTFHKPPHDVTGIPIAVSMIPETASVGKSCIFSRLFSCCRRIPQKIVDRANSNEKSIMGEVD